MTTTARGIRSSQWQALDPKRATELVDARLQFHHAAQLATAVGISYLAVKPDDSHTNLEWLPAVAALASRATTTRSPFRLAVRPSHLALLLLDGRNGVAGTYALNGRTIDDAAAWARAQLADFGADPAAFTLKRHYTIPSHPVADGARFDTRHADRFEQLSRWYADAALVFERLVAATPNASEVRCWPHDFDIATLIEVTPAKGKEKAPTVGVGMEPGDQYYAQPYFYVNMYPSPTSARGLPPLGGAGSWHTNEWMGAVLAGSRLEETQQREQIEAFVGSAVRACMELVRKL